MKNVFFLSLIPVLLMISSCSQAQKKENEGSIAKNVSVQEFSKLIAEKPGQLIDVRTPEENKAGFIEKAVLMNIHDADFEEKLNTLDKEKPVYVYCRSGGRSGRAMQIMQEKGFKEVYNLEGGFTAWQGSNMKVTK